MYRRLWNKLHQHLNVYVFDDEQNHKDHHCSLHPIYHRKLELKIHRHLDHVQRWLFLVQVKPIVHMVHDQQPVKKTNIH